MIPPPYRFLTVYKRFGRTLQAILGSDEYRDAVQEDFAELPETPKAADAFFGYSQIVKKFGSNPATQVWAWERLLRILWDKDPEKYARIHKGTPFYFLATAAYVGGDFEKALAFMDAAVEEDRRLPGDRWRNAPSGLFFRLQSENQAQFARDVVIQVKATIKSELTKLVPAGGPKLTLSEVIERFIEQAIGGSQELRSAVTALFTFVLEFKSRLNDLELLPPSGTGELVYIHLFKGALLFETLLKTSKVGRTVSAATPKATLGTFLANQNVYRALGFDAAPQGLGGDTFDEIFLAINGSEFRGQPFRTRVVSATWDIRNKIGHSLAWPQKPSPQLYEYMFTLVFGAIALVMAQLY
jgi:hypothetical protein